MYPCPAQLAFRDHSYHPMDRLVVEAREGLTQTGGHNPRLRPKQEHSLDHHHIEFSRRPLISPFSPQYTYYPPPLSLHPLQIQIHLWTYVVCGKYNVSQVLE